MLKTEDEVTRVTPPGGAANPQGRMLGTSAASYILEEYISSGGCGAVYSARHQETGQLVAMKIMHSDMRTTEEMRQRFVREAEAANKINHPNIIKVLESGVLEDGAPFICMERLSGPNVSQLVQQRGRLSMAEALYILEPVCQALHAAHEHGIVHRDIKGSNVVFDGEGEQRVIKLLDFGIAKLMYPEPGLVNLTAPGQRIGTPSCMSPEQILGAQITPRTDIYALGVMLYQLLTGQAPFRATTTDEMERSHLNSPPPPPSRLAPISPEIDAITMRCLEKIPDRRFPDVLTFLEALRATVKDSAGAAPTTTVRVFAVAVDARLSPEAQEDPSDAVLADLSYVLDSAEHALRAAGFTVISAGGNTLLGALVLLDEPTLRESQQRSALKTALKLSADLKSRAGVDPALHVNVCVHVDMAQVRTLRTGPEILGGPLLATADWLPSENLEGLVITPQCATEAPVVLEPTESPSFSRVMRVQTELT